LRIHAHCLTFVHNANSIAINSAHIFSNKPKNRIANFVVSLQAYFALCNKKYGELVRTGICRMLEDHADVQVIGQAESGEEAINLVRQHHPNVVLLDVNMPGIGGVETTRRLLQTAPDTKVLAVSGLAEEPYPSLLLKAGAKGYITKGAPVTEMVRAINKVMQGGKYFSADIAEQLASSYLSDTQTSPFDALSEREMQVAMMVVNCISAQEISDKLFVSVKTVNTYRYRIFEKLNIDSDVKLTHLAIRYGLIKP